MAITSLRGCFDKHAAIDACSYVDSAIYDLNQMIGSIKNARNCVNKEVYNIGGNTFENRIDSLINRIENEIEDLKNFKQTVINKAIAFYNEDYAEYQEYKKLEAEKAAENTSSEK